MQQADSCGSAENWRLRNAVLCAARARHSVQSGHDDLVKPLPRSFDTPLPIDAVLGELARTLSANNAAVLVAPPGAEIGRAHV